MKTDTERLALFDTLLDSLAHLVAGTDIRVNTVYPKAALTVFDGFELFDPRLSDDEIAIGDDVGDTPVWPMDARYGFPKEEHDLTGWLFTRVATLDLKKWRGRLRLTFPRMVEINEAFIDAGGHSWSSSVPVGLARGRAVDCLAHNHARGGDRIALASIYGRASRNNSDDGTDNHDSITVRIAHGVELRREYLWSVLLGEEGVPRARFVTDPTGVREAFRLRDIPPGKARRAALRHWVRQHWRQHRDASAEEKIFVREYLRGATSFGWNGLSCAIEPSREDLRRATIPPPVSPLSRRSPA